MRREGIDGGSGLQVCFGCRVPGAEFDTQHSAHSAQHLKVEYREDTINRGQDNGKKVNIGYKIS